MHYLSTIPWLQVMHPDHQSTARTEEASHRHWLSNKDMRTKGPRWVTTQMVVNIGRVCNSQTTLRTSGLSIWKEQNLSPVRTHVTSVTNPRVLIHDWTNRGDEFRKDCKRCAGGRKDVGRDVLLVVKVNAKLVNHPMATSNASGPPVYNLTRTELKPNKLGWKKLINLKWIKENYSQGSKNI